FSAVRALPAAASVLRVVCRRPPLSTPFPYTTLFRSSLRRAVALRGRFQLRHRDRHGGDQLWCALRRPQQVHAMRGRRTGEHLLLDRKSTRLNSSHVKISYAVFCLKKKK